MKLNKLLNSNGETRLVGEILARILGKLNGRRVISIQPIMINRKCEWSGVKANVRITFLTNTERYFSLYADSVYIERKVSIYFRDLIHLCIEGKEEYTTEMSLPTNKVITAEAIEDDLPF